MSQHSRARRSSVPVPHQDYRDPGSQDGACAAGPLPPGITDEIAKAFLDARSDDAVTRLSAFGRLEREGLATSHIVGGRFVHLNLNALGIELRDELEKADA